MRTKLEMHCTISLPLPSERFPRAAPQFFPDSSFRDTSEVQAGWKFETSSEAVRCGTGQTRKEVALFELRMQTLNHRGNSPRRPRHRKFSNPALLLLFFLSKSICFPAFTLTDKRSHSATSCSYITRSQYRDVAE